MRCRSSVTALLQFLPLDDDGNQALFCFGPSAGSGVPVLYAAGGGQDWSERFRAKLGGRKSGSGGQRVGRTIGATASGAGTRAAVFRCGEGGGRGGRGAAG